MTHNIGNGEVGGDLIVGADIAKLVEIEEEDKFEENKPDHHYLADENLERWKAFDLSCD